MPEKEVLGAVYATAEKTQRAVTDSGEKTQEILRSLRDVAIGQQQELRTLTQYLTSSKGNGNGNGRREPFDIFRILTFAGMAIGMMTSLAYAYISPLIKDVEGLQNDRKVLAKELEGSMADAHRTMWQRFRDIEEIAHHNQNALERIKEARVETESQMRQVGRFLNEFEQEDEFRDSLLWRRVFKETMPRRDYWPTFGSVPVEEQTQ